MKISIIIPTYNSEKYILRCLDSIKRQKAKSFEIIIVNDGSTDNTLKLIDSYNIDNKKIITIENHGQGYARNLALTKATGDYILFLDSDDILLDRALEVLVDVAEKNKVDVINFNYQIRNLDGDVKVHTGVKKENGKILGDCSILLSNKFYFTVNNLYSRKFLEENGIKYGEGYIYEDYEFWVKVAICAKSLVLLDDVLYEVIKEETSTTNSEHQTQKHSNDFLKACRVCLEYAMNEKRDNIKYLYKYILNRFFLYYAKRTPKKLKRKFLEEFTTLLSEYKINDFGTKKFNLLVKYKVFENKRYVLFKFYTNMYCFKRYRKRGK